MALEIDCVIMRQKRVELYLFTLDARRLLKITYVDPQTRDDPEQIQRLLNQKRLREIGDFIQHPASLIPNNIVINLNSNVEILRHADGRTGTVKFPNDDGKHGYILDGQHRLRGFEFADGVNFDLAIVALHNLDSHKAGKIFVDINAKQTAADKRLIFNIREAIGDLPNQEERAAAIVQDLDEFEESPLFGKIARFEDDKRKWVKSPSLIKWIAKLVDVGGTLAGRNRSEQTEILISYLNAVRELWPEAIRKRTEYYTWYPTGIEVVLEVFPNVFQRVVLNHGQMFTVENFVGQMGPVKNYSIEGDIPWQKEGYKPYSSGAGRRLLIKNLQNLLPPVTEE